MTDTLKSTSNVQCNVKFLNNNSEMAKNSNFGILSVLCSTKELLFKDIHWIFTIDKSGSMGDHCSDGKTKMEHIHQVLINMINYFIELSEKHNINQFITIIGFNHENDIICYERHIDKSLLDSLDIIKKRLVPHGMTNIEMALKTVTYNINKQSDQLDLQVVNIFMSDGEITSGEKSLDLLKEELKELDNNHVFIGYGENHDTKLMKSLADHPRGEYFFIESFENAGMVYGEIIHSSLYECIKDVSIKLDNGKIYDYKNNDWVSELEISALISNKERVWHIQKTSEDFKTEISYTDLCSQEKSPLSSPEYEPITFNTVAQSVSRALLGRRISVDPHNSITTVNMKIIRKTVTANLHYPDKEIDKEVEKYWWRQRTQEYMNIVSEHINLQNEHFVGSPRTLYCSIKNEQSKDLFRTSGSRNILIQGSPHPPHTSPSHTSPPIQSTHVTHANNQHHLLDAAKAQLWEIALLILDKYPDLINKIPLPRRFGVIHHAVHQGNIIIFDDLIRRNADIQLKTSDNKDCLTLAIENKQDEMIDKVKALLSDSLEKYTRKELQQKKDEIVNNLNKFMGNIKIYMKTHNLEEDLFMKGLCDDIYISIRSLYSTYGNMFIEARMSSQGKQRAYYMQNIDSLERTTSTTEPSPILNHTLSRNNSSPYATNDEMRVMRSCSNPQIMESP